MIVDGKAAAAKILARTKVRASKLARVPRVPRVVAIVANETAATRSYLSIKAKYAKEAGCEFEIQEFPENVSTAALCAAVSSAKADALIVQLPLPPHIDPREVCDAIPVGKDADVLSSSGRAAFENEKGSLLPPVVAAIRDIFANGQIKLEGKKAVVIGEGWLVGKPSAIWLAEQGAQVEVITEKSENFHETLAAADIIISGAGHPHLIKPEMIKDGVVLVDAGTSESGGQVAGDADPACASKCSLFTPVPGGLGPIAVACLFENAVTLAER